MLREFEADLGDGSHLPVVACEFRDEAEIFGVAAREAAVAHVVAIESDDVDVPVARVEAFELASWDAVAGFVRREHPEEVVDATWAAKVIDHLAPHGLVRRRVVGAAPPKPIAREFVER